MHACRTVLEQQIRERRQTLEEFAEYAESFARDHGEEGTLSLRHLQRLVAGKGPNGQPLGALRPATARLLESIFGRNIDELLAEPAFRTSAERGPSTPQHTFERIEVDTKPQPRRDHMHGGTDLSMSFDWLDEHAQWLPDTSRRKVMSRLAKLDTREVGDRNTKRGKVRRSQLARALRNYYGDSADGHTRYRVRCGEQDIETSVLTHPEWLDLACPLTPDRDGLQLVRSEPSLTDGNLDVKHAVNRLAEAAALDVRVANAPLYRLLSLDAGADGITGTVGRVPFTEYALTMDLLETELLDALATGTPDRLPLREKYLPNLSSVLDLSNRLCAGGALALVAIARPPDPYRGGQDYALLVQERSARVLNAPRRLSVIPKCFHQPLKDPRADVRIGATLRREMEEELFGRGEVDSTAAEHRVAEPMHPERLSAPMRWLVEVPSRMRMECTGFGLNLVSGNYEFASLIVVESEEFWTHYGGDLEANWEASGFRLYSSLDEEMLTELAADESWSHEGLFALFEGLRRLSQIGGDRVSPRPCMPAPESSR